MDCHPAWFAYLSDSRIDSSLFYVRVIFEKLDIAGRDGYATYEDVYANVPADQRPPKQ